MRWDKQRKELANRLERWGQLPSGVTKAAAALLFLLVAFFCVSGGALVIASFMHLLIAQFDMPPTMTYPLLTTTQVSTLQNAPAAHHSGSSLTFEAVPRPTLAHALDRAVERLHNPADSYIQADAVDVGLLMQREIHQLLLHVFDKATRSTTILPDSPVEVPLTNSQ